MSGWSNRFHSDDAIRMIACPLEGKPQNYRLEGRQQLNCTQIWQRKGRIRCGSSSWMPFSCVSCYPSRNCLAFSPAACNSIQVEAKRFIILSYGPSIALRNCEIESGCGRIFFRRPRKSPRRNKKLCKWNSFFVVATTCLPISASKLSFMLPIAHVRPLIIAKSSSYGARLSKPWDSISLSINVTTWQEARRKD